MKAQASVPARLVTLSGLLLVLALGCGNNGADETSVGGARYVMSTAVTLPDNFSGFVFPVETLEDTRAYAPTSALELPGGGWIAGIPGTSSFLAVGESNRIQRWTLDADGSFSPGAEFAVAQLGVGDNVRAIRVLNETRGWIAVGALLIEFDPSAMQIVRTVELSELVRDGWQLTASLSGLSYLRGDSLFFGFHWFTGFFDEYRLEMGLVHIDLPSGAITVSAREGCGEIDSGYVASNGDIYWVSGGRAPLPSLFLSRVDPSLGQAPTSCLVRLPAGATRLDQAEITDLITTAGVVAAELAPLGEDGLIRVLDQAAFDAYEFTDATTSRELAGAALWTWQRIDPESLTLSPFEGIPAAGVLSPSYPLRDGRLVPGPPAPDFSSTTYYLVDPDGTVAQSITLPGAALGVFELGPAPSSATFGARPASLPAGGLASVRARLGTLAVAARRWIGVTTRSITAPAVF